MESAEAAGWKFERQILLRRISDLEAEAKVGAGGVRLRKLALHM
jgi:hypothetical protein